MRAVWAITFGTFRISENKVWGTEVENEEVQQWTKLSQAAELLICIPEVPGSNFGWNTEYPVCFSLVLPCKCWDSASN